MKHLIILIIITLFSFSPNEGLAQKTKKTAIIIIKTSTQCGMCKSRIEKAMAYEKGIISSSLDVDKAEFTVTYKLAKTTPKKIREAISNVGYDADDVKANKKAYDNLPGCCQKGGHGM